MSPEMCDMLLKDRAKLEEVQASIGDGAKADKSKRDSKICWAPQNHWIESILFNYALYANESAGWFFQVGRPEPVQLTAYEKNSFYGWHEDWAPFSTDLPMRKLSAVLLLSDPDDFEGGKFEFDEHGEVEMKRGSLIAFPSFLRHQVTPVTKGTRYSAACWVTGPRTF